MSGSLDGCRTKIERAKRHVHELQDEIRSFFTTNPYVVRTKRDPQTRRLIYYLASVRETPPTLAAITGDILQNLRSALDHLAYQLVFVGTGGKGPFEHVYFPISDSATKYTGGRNGKVKGMRNEAIQAINAIKPYKGGNDLLWQLHELNIVDKHRLLVTVGSAYRSIDIGPVLHRGLVKASPELAQVPAISLHLRPTDRLFPLKEGSELFIDVPDAEPDGKVQFTFEIAFGEPGIAEGEDLLETLQQMVDVVDSLIPSFAPLVR